jgi:hypothetical protein
MSPQCAVIEVGRPDHEAEYCAWKFGHPRAEIVAMLENGIRTTRPEIHVQVGLGAQKFEGHVETKGIYATGWDGSVVMEAGPDGAFHRVTPDVWPAL